MVNTATGQEEGTIKGRVKRSKQSNLQKTREERVQKLNLNVIFYKEPS